MRTADEPNHDAVSSEHWYRGLKRCFDVKDVSAGSCRFAGACRLLCYLPAIIHHASLSATVTIKG